MRPDDAFVPNIGNPDDRLWLAFSCLSVKAKPPGWRKRVFNHLTSWPVLALMVLAVVVALVTVPSYRVYRWYAVPNEIRALEDNREHVNEYVKNLRAGRIPKRADGQGYFLLDVLYDRGLQYVREEEGCVVFTFASLPPDSIPTLIYSPSGMSGLPVKYVKTSERDSVFDFRDLGGGWFYMRWDLR